MMPTTNAKMHKQWPRCKNNQGVVCEHQTECDHCGWNPDPCCDELRQSRTDWVLKHQAKDAAH
ncbi:hypothetical protein [Treponema sp.]|uniref:hypothetical protein n=1 Tax=Treponema sp. TaxID=166 RepID=UPI003890B1BA